MLKSSLGFVSVVSSTVKELAMVFTHDILTEKGITPESLSGTTTCATEAPTKPEVVETLFKMISFAQLALANTKVYYIVNT